MTNLNYQQTHFVMSAPDIRHLPSDTGIEVAFAGRSNAGKSSALNTLTNQKSLARTSKTPGRTQLINLFEVADGKRLVDLPGYGYAEVPEEMKRKWQRALGEYLFRGHAFLKRIKGFIDDHCYRSPNQHSWVICNLQHCFALLLQVAVERHVQAVNAADFPAVAE